MEAKLFFKYGTIYREVIHTPRFDWCGIAKDFLQPIIPNPMSAFFQLIRDTAPEAVHTCPYTVRCFFKLSNLSTNSKLFQGLYVRNRTVNVNAMKSVFPRGEYKTIVYLYAGNNEPICTMNFIGDVKSQLKESFGKK